MAKTIDSKLQELIAAIKARKVLDYSPMEVVQPSELNSAVSTLRRGIAPILDKLGLPLEKVDQLQKQHMKELRRLAEQGEARIAERFLNLKHPSHNRIEALQKALESIATSGGILHAAPVNLPTPFLIWATPLDMMVDSSTAPWNSWAKVKASRTQSAIVGSYDRLSFYFLWDNPYDYYLLVNVASSLVAKGVGVVTGDTGIFEGGFATLFTTAQLELFEPAGDPPNYIQGTETKLIFDLRAKGGGFWSLETGKIDSKAVYAAYDVRHDWLPIHPKGRAVFEVALSLKYTIFGDGEARYDFANNTFDYFVRCPAVLLTVLSPTPEM